MWFLWRGRKPVLPRLESLPGGGDGGQVLAHRLDDSATPHPQSGADAHATVQQQPNGRGHVCGHAAGCVNEPQSDQRANGITAEGRGENDGIQKNMDGYSYFKSVTTASVQWLLQNMMVESS